MLGEERERAVGEKGKGERGQRGTSPVCCFGHDNCQLVCVPSSILNRLLCMATCELPFYYFYSYLLYYLLFAMEPNGRQREKRERSSTEDTENNLGA